jgi:hypothetical protein
MINTGLGEGFLNFCQERLEVKLVMNGDISIGLDIKVGKKNLKHRVLGFL